MGLRGGQGESRIRPSHLFTMPQRPECTMTRAELIENLAEKFPQLLQKDTELAVRLILDEMTSTLCKGGRIEVRGFGSFGSNHHPARNGRNPKTGAKVSVPAKYVPHFKPGKELRERVMDPK